jgi:DeoR/GlpR family transcriptional regulator of sugar metabolism
LDRLWFDQLFLGAGAISDAGEIYSSDEQEARLNRRMLARTSAPVIMADSGKFGQRLTYQVAALPAGARVVSDSGLGAERLRQLQDMGCTTTLVGAA